jgi:hypothetical protein
MAQDRDIKYVNREFGDFKSLRDDEMKYDLVARNTIKKFVLSYELAGKVSFKTETYFDKINDIYVDDLRGNIF